MISCQSCRADNPQGARFCNQCGIPLSLESAGSAPGRHSIPDQRQSYTPQHLVERVLKTRQSLAGERKRVTVLFADIKGSTRIAEQAGAESWHEILDRFFVLLAECVHRYEGTVNQYTGDGIMALFGAPVAHEDHAQRACHAALDIQVAIRQFADELRLERGLNLTVRIGLNTGEVIVGKIGDDLRMDYTAQGVTVNLAARLEHICEPGQVYVSESTARLVETFFSMRSLGATDLRGVEEPVGVFALLTRTEAREQIQRQLARGTEHFLGREQELAVLQASMARAAAGQGQVIGLSGIAGIGKTRLCHEFLAASDRRGVSLHRSSASPYSRHDPTALMREIFLSRVRQEVGVPDESRLRVVLRAAIPEELMSRPGAEAFALDFAGIAHSGELNEAQASSLREPMMHALARYLPAVDSPQIICLEDIHHLDEYTADFVHCLAREVEGTRTLLLLSWRSDHRLEKLPNLDEKLLISALTRETASRLASIRLGNDGSLAGLAERIAGRSDGNPFFVEEAVASLAEAGHLQGQPGAFVKVRGIEQWPIPTTVHGLIAARVDRLSDDAKQCLQVASVIGSCFEPAVLCAVAGLESNRTEQQLCELSRRGFLRQSEEESHVWEFTQTLIREVTYESQLESARKAIHLQLADVLEARCPSNPVCRNARKIADHLALAGHWARAGRWNLHAAQWFGARDVHLTTAQYRLALRHLDLAADNASLTTLKVAARSGVIRMGQMVDIDRAEIDRAFTEAKEMVKASDDLIGAAELAISYSSTCMQHGETSEAMRWIEEAIFTLPAEQRAKLIDRFRLVMLVVFTAAGGVQRGLELINREGGADWLNSPIRQDTSMSRAFICVNGAWLGDIDRACRDLAEAIRLTESDGRSASWMHGLKVEMAWFSGHSEGVLESSCRALEQAEAFGSNYFRALALRARGQALLILGQPAEAIEPLEEGRELSRPGQSAHLYEAHLLAVLAEAHRDIGDVDHAIKLARFAVAEADKSGANFWELRALMALLSLPNSILDDREADAAFERAKILIDRSGAVGVSPKFRELRLLRRSPLMASDRDWQLLAKAYEAVGAGGHAERIRRLPAG